MTSTILTAAGAVLCAAVLLGIGVALGRWSKRDDIDELEDRLGHAEYAIAQHIAHEDKTEAEMKKVREDLVRERGVSNHAHGELNGRRIGVRPIWTQLNNPEPLPIDERALAWEGSQPGETGQWRIPDEVREAVDLHIIDAELVDPFAWMDGVTA